MMDGRTTILLACVVLGASCFLGCSKTKDESSTGSSLTAATRESIDAAVSAYESIRESLAEDRSDVGGQALALADSAQTALASAPSPLHPPLRDLVTASRQLAGVAGSDLGAARRAFGDVSRALISVLSAEPSLHQDIHVYECPMAKGYKRWVQVAEGAANPYMGRDMLQCGTEIEL